MLSLLNILKCLVHLCRHILKEFRHYCVLRKQISVDILGHKKKLHFSYLTSTIMGLVEFCNLVLPREAEEACSQNQQFSSRAHPLPAPQWLCHSPWAAWTGSRCAHMDLLSPLVKHKPLGQGLYKYYLSFSTCALT